MVESSALLKRRTPKGYRGFESLPHRFDWELDDDCIGEWPLSGSAKMKTIETVWISGTKLQ